MVNGAMSVNLVEFQIKYCDARNVAAEGLAAPAQPSAGRALHVAFSLILQNSVTQCNRALPRQHENQQTPAPQTVGWLYTYLQQCFQSLQQC